MEIRTRDPRLADPSARPLYHRFPMIGKLFGKLWNIMVLEDSYLDELRHFKGGKYMWEGGWRAKWELFFGDGSESSMCDVAMAS